MEFSALLTSRCLTGSRERKDGKGTSQELVNNTEARRAARAAQEELCGDRLPGSKFGLISLLLSICFDTNFL